MEEKNYTGLIPANYEGKKITAEAVINASSAEEAKSIYQNAKRKLLLVQNWGKITGTLSADFELTDNTGKIVDRSVQQNDHFRIDIAGPGSKAGEGYDWAIVEEIKEVNNSNVDSIAIRVKPAENPQTNSSSVAHFFSKQSTSTFVITREGNKVSACIYDRNIEANDETKDGVDKVRNTMVGFGAKHGFSKLQWNALAEALIKTD